MSTPESSHAERFLQALLSDEAFRQKFEAVADQPEAVLKLAAAEGLSFAPQDLKAALERHLGGSLDGDLSDEMLASIAGGSFGLELAFRAFKGLTVFAYTHADKIYPATVSIPAIAEGIKNAITD